MLKRILWASGAALAVLPAYAHHSTAMFDRSQRLWAEGTVKEWEWTNPHAWLQITAPDKAGTSVEQGFELGAPNTLIRDGFRKDTFKVGEKVKVLYSPRKDGTVGGLYYCARTADGHWMVFGMGPNSTPPTECKD
ncbi:MAG: DUF6152 family protein [Steroidobacteraceae bacterium]